jgi:anti-anti-sigma factor
MNLAQGRHLAVVTPVPGVRVLRFACPDLRPQLDDDGTTDGCELYREIQRYVLSDLRPGELLVLNLGQVEFFTPAFLSVLLSVRLVVRQRLARLVLCELSERQRDLLNITRTMPLFTIADDEHDALRTNEPQTLQGWHLASLGCPAR